VRLKPLASAAQARTRKAAPITARLMP
jgi:hypothetical protein